jgi:hypothetical protein
MNKTLFQILAAAAIATVLIVPASAATDPSCVFSTSGVFNVIRPLGDTNVPYCPSIVGTWEVTVQPNGGPAFGAVNVFYADGNSIEFDNSNSPAAQTVAAGPWKKINANQYTFIEINQIFDEKGAYGGRVQVKATITLNEAGDKFTSTFTVTVLDPTGVELFQGSGTATGTRVKL